MKRSILRPLHNSGSLEKTGHLDEISNCSEPTYAGRLIGGERNSKDRQMDVFNKGDQLCNGLILLLLLLFTINSLGYSAEPEFRSFEYMAKNPWTDHVKHFNKLFKIVHVHSFLEFGVGEGTKFFLDHCDEVTSLELVSKRVGVKNKEYYEKCVNLFADYSNWNPKLYECTDAIKDAELFAETKQQHPARNNPLYLKELKSVCDEIFQNKQYDVAFVDPGILIRGDLVNELFGRVDIIVAHDISFHPSIYGWSWIKKPSDYEKISFFDGSGTAFWIRKTKSKLIEDLKKLPKN